MGDRYEMVEGLLAGENRMDLVRRRIELIKQGRHAEAARLMHEAALRDHESALRQVSLADEEATRSSRV